MKKNLLLIASALIAGVAISIPSANHFLSADIESPISFEDKLLGDYFEIPDKTITSGQTTKAAKFRVVSPCGATYTDKNLIANEVGEWKVVYYELFNGFPFEETYTFKVSTKSYQAKKSSFFVGPNTEFFKNSGNGINLKLAKDDVFECAEFIDLAALTSKNPFIEIGLAPSSKGNREITELTVRLTDVYDDNNYVDYKLHDPNIKEDAYPGLGTVECTFTGQDSMMGLEHITDNGGKFVEKFIINNNGYGSYTYLSFTGDYYETDRSTKGGPSDPLAYLAFNANNQQCLVLDKHNGKSDSIRYPEGSKLIADLSRTDYTPDEQNSVTLSAGKHGFTEAFKGFKDKKAKLSIFASGFTGSDCGIFISKINNKKITNISSITYDVLNPIVDVDTLEFNSDNLPVGKVNVPYNIFKATGIDDFSSEINLHTNIYYLSNDVKTYSLPIKNGSFVPNKVGTYLLEYTATDGANNQSVKSYRINVQETVNVPTLVPGFEVLPTSANCGTTITLPEPIIGVSSGNPKLDIKVTIGSREIPVNNGKLFLGEKGNYKITYTVTDYIGQKTSLYTMLTATVDTKPVLLDEIPFYPSFIAGKKYKLESVLAYDYNIMKNNEPSSVKARINVSHNGSSISLTNNEFTVPNVESGNVKVSFIFSGSKGTLSVNKDVPIVKLNTNTVKNEDILKYFVEDDGITKTVDNDAVTFTFNNEGKVQFINKVPTFNANFLLNIGKSGPNTQNFANKINVYFMDTLDSSKQVKVSLISRGRAASTSYIQVNDGEKKDCSGNFTGLKTFDFSLDTKTNQVICDYVNKLPILTYTNGNKFEGFHNNSAFVSFEIEGLTEGKKFMLQVMTLAGQTCFLNPRGDQIPAVIQVNGEAEHRYAYGEIIETFTATAFDVFQPTCSLNFSIVDDNNDPIKLLDGTLASNLDPTKTYKFKMDIYGNYFGVYKSDDGLGNTSNKRILYVVEDDQKPELHGTFGKAIKVKLNDTVKFDRVSFTDNLTTSENISYICYAKDPNGVITRITNGKGSSVKLEYKFTKLGKWVITWSAEDESGNTAFADLAVYVE